MPAATVLFTPRKGGRTFEAFTQGLAEQIYIKYDCTANTVAVKSDEEVILHPEEPGLINLGSGLNDKTLLVLARQVAAMTDRMPWQDVVIRTKRAAAHIREVMNTVKRINRDDLCWAFFLRAAGETVFAEGMDEGDRYRAYLEGMVIATEAAANKRHLPFSFFPGLELDMHQMLVHWARTHTREIGVGITHPTRSVIALEAVEYGLWKGRNDVDGYPRRTCPTQLSLEGFEPEKTLSAADMLREKRLPGRGKGQARAKRPDTSREAREDYSIMPSEEETKAKKRQKKRREKTLKTFEETASMNALAAFFA